MRFEWDYEKSEINRKKHGITFEEVSEVFSDPLHLSILDERFNYFEERWITIGQTSKDIVIVVAHLIYETDGEETIRLISARQATSHERRQYEGNG